MSYLPSMPDATLYEIFKAHPQIARPLQQLAEVLMRKEGPFSVAECELIAAFTSRLNGCRFCTGVHTRIAELKGIEKGFVARAGDDLEAAAGSAKIKPVLAYVKKLTEAPSTVTKADIDAILAAGWGEDAVVYANMICGHFNLMNRMLDGLGIEASQENIASSVEFLEAHGYEGVLAHL